MTTTHFKPGAIFIWREYSKLRTWVYKLLNKDLKYNRYCVSPYNRTLITDIVKNVNDFFIVIEPRKPYSKAEQAELIRYMLADPAIFQKLGVLGLSIINHIRENTIDVSTITLDKLIKNKYYKVSYDGTGKNEYIHTTIQ